METIITETGIEIGIGIRIETTTTTATISVHQKQSSTIIWKKTSLEAAASTRNIRCLARRNGNIQL